MTSEACQVGAWFAEVVRDAGLDSCSLSRNLPALHRRLGGVTELRTVTDIFVLPLMSHAHASEERPSKRRTASAAQWIHQGREETIADYGSGDAASTCSPQILAAIYACAAADQGQQSDQLHQGCDRGPTLAVTLAHPQTAALAFLQSASFFRQYFERWPLLLRSGRCGSADRRRHGDGSDAGGGGSDGGTSSDSEAGGTGNCDGDRSAGLPWLQRLAAHGLGRLLELGSYTYGMDKRESHHRNVWLVDASFDAPHPSWRPGQQLSPTEVATGVAAGWTAIFDGAQLFLPEVAELVVALSRIFDRRVNANIYVAKAGLATAMAAHNDLQCTCIFQVCYHYGHHCLQSLLLQLHRSDVSTMHLNMVR